jgi:predicted Rossmann-fold nucleotide-binding protein
MSSHVLGGSKVSSDPRLYELAREYHEACQAYCQVVCTGPLFKGVPMAATLQEGVAIGTHAREVRRRLSEEAQVLGFTAQDLYQAVVNYARFNLNFFRD